MMRWWVFGEDQLNAALEDFHMRLAWEHGDTSDLSVDIVRKFLSSPEAAQHGLIGKVNSSTQPQPQGEIA